MRPDLSLLAFLLAAAFTMTGCGEDPPASNQNQNDIDAGVDAHEQDAVDDEEACQPRFADAEGNPFETLSEYCFFKGPIADHEPQEGILLYDVTAPLYSDHSRKRRYISLPAGETIGFEPADHWRWPDETTIIKTFYYPVDATNLDAGEQLLETRLLRKEAGSWSAEVYLWDEDQQEARRHSLGRRIDVSFVDEEGHQWEIEYRVPNTNQCRNCHGQDGEFKLLGPRTYQLLDPFGGAEEGPAQLTTFEELGIFEEALPPLDTLARAHDYRDESLDIETRARSYLDANCAHCHNPAGRASSSNLFLEFDRSDARNLGVCKHPVAAGEGAGGLTYDIVPGHPEESIVVFRLNSNDPAIKMPELPLSTIDTFGVDLVSQWIESMEPAGCD